MILCAFSKASLVLINIPFLLALPDAITIARGVANPRLHGHATTNIVTNMFIALKNGNIKSIKNNLIKRKIINYFRNILVSLKTFLKSIINK